MMNPSTNFRNDLNDNVDAPPSDDNTKVVVHLDNATTDLNDLETGTIRISTEQSIISSSLSTKDQLQNIDKVGKQKMETFEIEHSCNEINIPEEGNTIIPLITTVPSLDESIDDEFIVEMESLLQPRNSKSNDSNDDPSIVSTNNSTSSNHHTNSTNGTTACRANRDDSSQTPSERTMKHQQVQSNGGGWCVPCMNDNNSDEGNVYKSVQQLGNIYVIYPPPFLRSCCSSTISNNNNKYWIMIGPHWFGPPCIITIILLTSYYIIYQKCYLHHQWYISMCICMLLCASTIYHLLLTAYSDPGIIIKNSLPININEPSTIPRSYRYCDFCQYYQPNHSMHCPQCNVCIAGFDHHCVWMSICIGNNNYKPFMRFNLSWMAYFIYSVVWVSGFAYLFD